MNWFQELIGNKVLVSGAVSWITAQVLKTIIYAVLNRRIRIGRLVGGGGMPSSHSATSRRWP